MVCGKMSQVRLAAFTLTAVLFAPVLGQVPIPKSALAQSFGDNPDSFPIPSSLPDGGVLRVDGSTSMQRTNTELEARFETQFPNVDVELGASRTDEALAALAAGRVDLVASGRPLTEEEQAQGLVAVPLEREKLAIILGPDNPFDGNLSFEQFAQIFRGEITNWSEVGGSDAPIRFIDRPDYSDTRRALSTYTVFEGKPFATGATAAPVDDDETNVVATALGDDGIGYAVVSQVLDRSDVRILSMHQTLPDDPRYPYSQYRSYVYKEDALTPAVAAFLGFAIAAPGQEVITEVPPATEATVTGDDLDNGDGGTVDSTDSLEGNAELPIAAEDTPVAGETSGASEGASPPASISDVAEDSETALLPDGPAAEAEEVAGFPWWLLLLLGIPLLGALLWWLLKDRQPPAVVDEEISGPAMPPPVPPILPTESEPVASPDPVTAGSAPVTPIADPATDLGNRTDTAAIAPPPETATDDLVKGSATAAQLPGAAIGLGAAAGAAGLAAMAAGQQNSKGPSVLITPQEDQTLEVAWTLPNEQIDTIKNQGGVTPKVRLYDVTVRPLAAPLPAPILETDRAEDNSASIQLAVPAPDRDYIADVGYQTAAGDWLSLGQSEAIRVEPTAAPTVAANDLAGEGLGTAAGTAMGAVAAGAVAQAAGLLSSDEASPTPSALARSTEDADDTLPPPPVEIAADDASLVPTSEPPGTAISSEAQPSVNILTTLPADTDGQALTAAPPETPDPVVMDADRPLSAPAIPESGAIPMEAAAVAGLAAGAVAGTAFAERQSESTISLTPLPAASALATWEVPVTAQVAAKAEGGQQYQLRIYDVTAIDLDHQHAHRLDIYPCDEGENTYTVPISTLERDYLAEIGYQTDDDRWLKLARSTHIYMAGDGDGLPIGDGSDGDSGPDGRGAESAAVTAVEQPTALIEKGGLAPEPMAVETTLAPTLAAPDRTDGIRLLLQTPTAAVASWKLLPSAVASVKAEGGEHYQLRLYDVTAIELDQQPAHRVDIYSCEEGDQTQTVPLPQPERDYLVEVGYQTADDRWLRLARSAHIYVPAAADFDSGHPSELPVTAVAGKATMAASVAAQSCAVQTVQVHSQHHKIPLTPEQAGHLQAASVTHSLASGLYILRIREGAFNYDGDDSHPGEPFVLIWLQGGTVMNYKTQVPVTTTWSTLNGYADTLTLSVTSPTTLYAFFIDTFPEDNVDAVTLSVIKI